MRFDYLITIVTRHRIDDDTEETKIIAHASFEGERDDYVIAYKEHEANGIEVITHLNVKNGKAVTVSREGEIKTNMVIDTERRTISYHNTPYGMLSMGISAIEVTSDMDKDGGTLKFAYQTDVEFKPVGSIEFDIKLKVKKKLHD